MKETQAGSEIFTHTIAVEVSTNEPTTVISPAKILTHFDALVNPPPVIETGKADPVLQKVFLPNWDNKPAEQKAIITLNGISILTEENTSAIIAQAGTGKSSLCEAVVASSLNHSADCLGFNVDPDISGVVMLDFERTNPDVWNSFYRVARRAGIQTGQPLNKTVIAGLRHIPRLDERLKTIEALLQNYPCGLLILDGAGDIVTDTNDLGQAIEARIFLRELTAKHSLSVLTTLHPNPKDFKPRGHIGSEIHREAECVLVAKSFEGDVRILTSDFEHGKNRNASHVTAGYCWSDEYKMFVSCDIDPDTKQQKRIAAKEGQLSELAAKVLPKLKAKSYSDLVSELMEITAKSKDTAKRLVSDLNNGGFIKKCEDGLYRNAN